MQQITDNLSNYKQNKSLPDMTIKKPLERIKELCTMIHFSGNETQLKNCLALIRIEIDRYDKTFFDGQELPF